MMGMAEQLDRLVLVVGDHLVVPPGSMVLHDGEAISPARARWVLQGGDMDGIIVRTCKREDCISHWEVSDPPAAMTEEQDERIVRIHSSANTLADLFKRARDKGLVTSSRAYN